MMTDETFQRLLRLDPDTRLAELKTCGELPSARQLLDLIPRHNGSLDWVGERRLRNFYAAAAADLTFTPRGEVH